MNAMSGTVPPVVSMKGVTKLFPGVVANKDVDLDIRPGEVHALLGENGAGKSTLMNCLTGIYKQDGGQILIDGNPVSFSSPMQAIAAGIGMVHQHFRLVYAFTVAENIHLGWPETPKQVSPESLIQRTEALAEKFNLAVTPGARIDELSAGEQQRVEILRVLSRGARILILDEPTAVLTPIEARELFKALDAFKAEGNAVIFISHKLEEALEISDRVTVLRGGKKVETLDTKGCTEQTLANLMVGRDLVMHDLRNEGEREHAGRVVMSLQNISALNERGLPALKNVSLDLRAGEILGIAGVAGNGQRELSEVLTGVRRSSEGKILIDDFPVMGPTPERMVQYGVGHIPEDRLRSGLAPTLSIADNSVIREYKSEDFAPGYFYSPRGAMRFAKELAKDANVMVPDFQMPVRNLSGGNQQRLVARREMRIAERVLVAAYPTRGLDVGAIDTMLNYMVELRDKGVSVVVISEELEELLNLVDRLAVLNGGEIMGIVDARDADMESIGLMMGGHKREELKSA